MLKYYFGYKSLFGAPFPVRWVEDNGVAVGGEVTTIQGNKFELTHKEFTYGDFNLLKEKYPYKEPKGEE
jgi:hypothetical protein